MIITRRMDCPYRFGTRLELGIDQVKPRKISADGLKPTEKACNMDDLEAEPKVIGDVSGAPDKTQAEPVAPETARPKAPRIKVVKLGNTQLVLFNGPDKEVGQELLQAAIGAVDPDFFQGLFRQLHNVSLNKKESVEEALNFMLSVIKGVEPKDQVESMLAAQMAVIHVSMMDLAYKLGTSNLLLQQESYARTMSSFARTFAAQMEALRKHRTGGEQRVTVQHVTVSSGANAIVGPVTQAVREQPPQQPIAQIAAPREKPMELIQEIGSEKKERAPIKSGRTDG